MKEIIEAVQLEKRQCNDVQMVRGDYVSLIGGCEVVVTVRLKCW